MSTTIYEMITTRVTELLEQGTVPWRKPWNAQSNMPKNMISRKDYRGINIFMLACQPYNSPYWMSFKQINDRGGHICKGEKSTPVIFWKWLDRKDTDNPSEGVNGKIPLLRYYNVFNIEQTDGITAPEPEETHIHFDPITKAEQIIAGMPLKPEC